jgi:hypothetical protein
VYPPKIIRAEVLANPFDDIVPRERPKKKAEEPVAPAAPKVRIVLALFAPYLVNLYILCFVRVLKKSG